MLKAADKRPNTVNAIIALGGWPQRTAAYENAMREFLPLLQKKRVIVLVGAAGKQQRLYLTKGLAHGNVGQTPYEMGRQAIHALHKIVKNKPYLSKISTPVIICRHEGNGTSCSPEHDEAE